MCRILFLKGTNKNKALDYIDAFYKAGYDDPHLQVAVKTMKINRIKNSHLHGWGYLLVTENSINTYLSGEAFYNDETGFENLKNQIKTISGPFLLMSELRLTDEGNVSALNSHPFFFSSYNGYEGCFFYNGLLDYEKLASLEGLNYSDFKGKNGTTIMGLSFSRELEKGSTVKQALLRPLPALKSGYNIMCFLNDNNGNFKAYINAYIAEKMLENKEYIEYVKLIKKSDDDLFFAGSNAISVYKNDMYTVMENAEFLEFDIDFIKQYYFNGYEMGIDMSI
ncbi:MAG: hypothetical protein PHS49_04765 [Candidatus Gracilibacteria bacterium]|nr:hypothetical protein [Candidatus Gracilibacteria bacterium]